MDETTPGADNPEIPIDEQDTLRLERARGYLFDDNFVRQATEKLRNEVPEELLSDAVDSKTGMMNTSTRAYNAFGNLLNVLPGNASYDPDSQFAKDFAEAAQAKEVDIAEIERISHDDGPSEEAFGFRLYRYVYPAIEKMVKDGKYHFTA